MKASSKRFLSILISAVMFIAAIFVYTSLVLPSYSDIKNLRAEIKSRSDIATEQQNAVNQVQKLLKEYQNVSSVENTIGVMMPLSPDAGLGLNQVASMASVSGLSVDSVSVSKTAITPSAASKMAKGVGILKFNFQLSGDYAGVKSFFQSMETNIALMDLSDLKISGAQGSRSGSGVLSVSGNVNMYYQAQ